MSAMQLTDGTEHRRGLVLGLTLAELLLLLLFLLLLALGARIQRLNTQIVESDFERSRLQASLTELEPLLTELRLHGSLSLDGAAALVLRLTAVRDLEQRLGELQKRNTELEASIKVVAMLGPEARSRLLTLEPILSMAAQIDPNDPPAVLKRAMEFAQRAGSTPAEVHRNLSALGGIFARAREIDPHAPAALLERGMSTIEQLGKDLTAEDLSNLKEQRENTEQIKKTITSLVEERERFRQQRDNLMKGGRGLMYPSCWTTETGETEYIFDVTIRDTVLVVRDTAPPYRRAHEAFGLLGEFQRGSEIPEPRFRYPKFLSKAAHRLLPNQGVKIVAGYAPGIRLHSGPRRYCDQDSDEFTRGVSFRPKERAVAPCHTC